MTQPEDPRTAIARQDYELVLTDINERLRLQGEFSLAAFRGLTLANGGAIVALFTFIGNSHEGYDSLRIWLAFGCFVAGLALTLASTMIAFIAQSYFMKHGVSTLWEIQGIIHSKPVDYGKAKKREMMVGNIAEGIAVGAAVLALLSFVSGAAFALAGVLA